MYDWLFWGLLTLFELLVLTLPLFPSGDGPLHVYFSSIFGDLATHSSPFYEHFYFIRHLVQPYSFHYYFLLALEHGMTADWAEKLFVMLICATLATGFRALARSLGAGSPAVSLWVFPLLLSWPLCGGFFNYTFAVGLLLWALAYYYRLFTEAKTGSSLAVLFGLLVLLVLAHPIPIMILIAMMGLDLLLSLLNGWRRERRMEVSARGVAALGLACVAFLFPIMIADKAQVASSIRSDLRFHSYYVHYLLSGRHVTFFDANTVAGWVLQIGVIGALPVLWYLFVRGGLPGRLRSGSLAPADRLLLAAAVYLGLTLWFPESMNGSALFAERMWFAIWLLLLACAAGLGTGLGTRQALSRAIAGSATALAALSLVFGLLYLRPDALRQEAIEHAPLPDHARGIFVQPNNGDSPPESHTSYPIFFWEGGRAFALHQDVLLNSPWMQLTIVPVGENGKAGLMRDFSPGSASENPNWLPRYFAAHPEQQQQALQAADFLLAADPNSTVPDPLRLAGDVLGKEASRWSCTQQGFYAVCTKRF